MRIDSITLKNFRGYENETKIDIEDLVVLVGKNDAGKSTILEALDIFFNEGKGTVKIDKDDVNVACKERGDLETIIAVTFSELPLEIIIDSTVPTTLENEYLLNKEQKLEIVKKYSNGGSQKVWIKAYHPTNESCSDLLLKTNTNLKNIIKDNNIECSNLTTNSIMRKSIWEFYKDDLALDIIEIDASKADAKQIWDKIYSYLPVYTLFQSDRSNTDSDSEIQDPLKEAVNLILKEEDIQNSLNEISEKVHEKLKEVSARTLEKLKEVDSEIANELAPVIPGSDKLKWSDVFKSVSISGDNNIPINKRGSGVKRLILMSFFRGEAERLAEEGGSTGIIYAVEEPETSQHTNNQKILIKAFKDLSTLPGVQVLLTTHSPDMVKELDFENIKIVGNELGEKKVLCIEDEVLNYPSLNEVNYLAFDEINEEYHNELYALIEFYGFKQNYFDTHNKMDYKRIRQNASIITQQVCLSEYIRHQIHHPENKENERYSSEQLLESINYMRSFIKYKIESGELIDPEI